MAHREEPTPFEDLDTVLVVFQEAVRGGAIPYEVAERLRLALARFDDIHKRRTETERIFLERLAAALNAVGGVTTTTGRPTNT